ncbi:ribosome biogenesis protein ytm1 [Coemansia sp. RSA 1813]|nr:ribosome biogenesis protein ytm1 [Coemansia sp. RSA 1843]KAJ2215629.1 ribosome biogenesis protein ytm1 [Coemansia sp. RSA 487]KAJ2568820.1 ribosome biogenesis protein ytm1 [Coemansia sp. RSA 1813]
MDVFVAKILEADAHSLHSTDALIESELTLDVAQQLSAELDARLKLCKAELRQSLVDNYGTYISASDEVERAQKSIAQLLHGVDELQAMFGDEETGIRARVIDAMEEEARARKQVEGNSAVLEGLRVLASINSKLRTMDALVRDARHTEAAEAARAVEGTVARARELDGTRIKAVLNDRIHLAAMNVKENVLRDLWRLVVFDVADSSATIRVNPLDGKQDCQSSSSSLAALHAALSSLDAGGELAHAFSDRFVRDFVAPLLSVPGLAQGKSNSSDDSDAASRKEYAVSLRRGSDSATPAATICGLLSEALAFVNQTLLLCPDGSSSVRSMLWAEECAARIATLVLDRCVLSCIPTTRKALTEFRDQVDVLVAFEEKLFDSLYTDAGAIEERPIRTKADQIEDLFARRRCDQALSTVRKLAESSSFSAVAMDSHETWSVDFVKRLASSSDSDDTECQVAPALVEAASAEIEKRERLLFPKCTVSAAIRGLVSTAYGLVNEGAQSCQDAAPQVAAVFVDAARCVFDVYRALFLTLHRAQLTRVPALGWQFFNDCMYAAHHAGILGSLAARVLGNSSQDTALPASTTGDGWASTAQLYVAVGKSHVATIVRQETDELRRLSTGSSSKGGNAFLGASSEAGKAQLAKIASQVRMSLTQLARAIRPPAVTPHIFYRTLGSYADAVSGATIDAIFSIGDIGMDDSQVLSDHCRAVHHLLVALFQLDVGVLESYSDVLPLPSPRPEAAPNSLYNVNDELLDSDDDSDAPAPSESEPARRSSPSAIKLANEYCTLADKLAQLADILVISRADIVARRRAGLLEDFSADELVALVYALFAATDDREHDIMMLESL